MCTTSSLQNWESRRRQWKMRKGLISIIHQEELRYMELWMRKDSKGHLELVDRGLLPFLDYRKRYFVPIKLLYSADFLSPGFLGPIGLLPLHVPTIHTLPSSTLGGFENMFTG